MWRCGQVGEVDGENTPGGRNESDLTNARVERREQFLGEVGGT